MGRASGMHEEKEKCTEFCWVNPEGIICARPKCKKA